MNKLYVAGIAFLLSFTGCIEDPDLEPVENTVECELVPYGHCSGEDLSGQDLSEMNLTGIDLSYANLSGASLTNLNYADLTGAELAYTNLKNAKLTGADLRDAKLTGANLTYANLSFADFTDAIVTDADFTDTIWYQTVWTDGVAYDENQAITQDYNMTVVEILDGDTFNLGNGERVRIIGINTPEKGRPFSDEATDALSEMIMGREVTLVNDSKNDDVDTNGRLLRHVYVDETLVNYEMIRMGMAFWYPYSSGTDMDESYQEAQESAANDHAGLWTESQYNIKIGRASCRERV